MKKLAGVATLYALIIALHFFANGISPRQFSGVSRADSIFVGSVIEYDFPFVGCTQFEVDTTSTDSVTVHFIWSSCSGWMVAQDSVRNKLPKIFRIVFVKP